MHQYAQLIVLVKQFVKPAGEYQKMAQWGFITNHGLVLASIAKHPRSTAREIGNDVGITERAAHKIINDLESEGYITKNKVGRQNHYQIHPNMPLNAESVSDSSVGELLVILGWKRRKKQEPATSQIITTPQIVTTLQA